MAFVASPSNGKYAINDGEHPNLSENKGDFFFMRRTNQEAARDLIVQLCAERLPKNMGISSDEIQVLTPTRKGAAGVHDLYFVFKSGGFRWDWWKMAR